MSFVARGVRAPAGFEGDGLVVRPLTIDDVELDHAAVMASREFLLDWEQDPPYPPVDFSIDDNRADVEGMVDAHRRGTRYTYTVMNPGDTMALGCVYVIPPGDPMFRSAEVSSHDGTDLSTVDATVSFWVRPETWGDGLERALLIALLGWFESAWTFERVVVITNAALDHQIATLEAAGLTRRFDHDRAKDLHTSHAYG